LEGIVVQQIKMSSQNKTMDDYGICGVFLMDYIRKGIDKCIDEGDYQYNIDLGGSLFKDKKKFIKDVIIPALTTHYEGDYEYATYRNGYYYYRNDCMCDYEIEYNGCDTMCFNRVESSDEESEESEGEEDE